MCLEKVISSQLAESGANRWVIAYSGGLDSTVLLQLVVLANQQLSTPKPVCALHINHQLSPNASSWQAHCEGQATALSVDFVAKQVDIELNGYGVEAAAREARYRVFEDYLQAGDCLLLGHHQDDQAETLLLRLCRGAGVLGLSAMPKERSLACASLLRPLLNIGRDQLFDYARQHHLSWIEDESNHSSHYDRNYLRHDVIPALTSRWPQVKKQLAQTTERLQKAQQLLDDLAKIDLQQLDERHERYGRSIDWLLAKALNSERLNNLIRYWCASCGMPLPDNQQLQQIHEQFFSRNAMLTSASVRWGSIECRQFNKRLYLMNILDTFKVSESALIANKSCSVNLEGAGRLDLLAMTSASGDLTGNVLIAKKFFDDSRCEIRWRKGGERCTPSKRDKSQMVKKLLQEYQLETWLRDRVPLLYINDELAAVGDLWVCSGFEPQGDEPALIIKWSLE